MVKNIKVTVVETGSLSLGLGFLTITAAKEIQQGRNVDEVLSIIEENDRQTFVYAALDSLEYLKRSGRVPWLLVGVAELLRIRPLLHLHMGKITIERLRTSSNAIKRMLSYVQNMGRIEELGVMHTNALEKAQQFAKFLQRNLALSATPFVVEATPVLGVHVGPGVLDWLALHIAATVPILNRDCY